MTKDKPSSNSMIRRHEPHNVYASSARYGLLSNAETVYARNTFNVLMLVTKCAVFPSPLWYGKATHSRGLSYYVLSSMGMRSNRSGTMLSICLWIERLSGDVQYAVIPGDWTYTLNDTLR